MSHLAVQAATKYKEKIFQILSVIQFFVKQKLLQLTPKLNH